MAQLFQTLILQLALLVVLGILAFLIVELVAPTHQAYVWPELPNPYLPGLDEDAPEHPISDPGWCYDCPPGECPLDDYYFWLDRTS